MGKSHKKGASRASHSKVRARDGPVEWSPKMTMNMSDLSRDDDFLNHLLVEKLGTGNIPLYVHKMDPMRPLPKTDPKDLMAIVQRVRFP
jgi:histone-lysine N-methyltransferase SUV420H